MGIILLDNLVLDSAVLEGTMGGTHYRSIAVAASRNLGDGRLMRSVAPATMLGLAVACGPTLGLADEGGVSFWLPGQFGSLAAAPQVPGWSLANVYYHASVSAGGDVAAARQFTIGRFTRTATIDLNASVKGRADIDFLSANYVFAPPVLGGQLAVGLGGAAGHNSTSIDGTLTVS